MGLYSVAFRQGKQLEVKLSPKGSTWLAEVGGRLMTLRLLGSCQEDGLQIEIDGRCVSLPSHHALSGAFQDSIESVGLRLPKQKVAPVANSVEPVVVKSPIPGVVLSLLVKPGQKVRKGEPLMILEAMKMENVVKAPADTIVGSPLCVLGQAMKKGEHLFELLPVPTVETKNDQATHIPVEPTPSFSHYHKSALPMRPRV